MLHLVFLEKSFHQMTFEIIKSVSITVLDMINAADRDEPLIFIDATFRDKSVIDLVLSFAKDILFRVC